MSTLTLSQVTCARPNCGKSCRSDPATAANQVGYVLPGVMTVTLHRRLDTKPVMDVAETKRYCPDCTLIMLDAFLELGLGEQIVKPLPPGNYNMAIGRDGTLEVLPKEEPTVCTICGEGPQVPDPGLSNGVCAYCGYWNIPAGPRRNADRARRRGEAQSAWSRTLSRMDYGPCDDCGFRGPLITKGDHHGGLKDVCTDRAVCNRRSPG